MTHKELLAKIDNVGHAVEYGHGIETSRIVKQLSALRAVVELAITAINGNPNTAYSMGYAAACERIIQAIEKELG